jgi:hypothetical protein
MSGRTNGTSPNPLLHDCVKQSQFGSPAGTRGTMPQNKPNLGELAGRRNTQHSTILSFPHSSPVLSCETNPIWLVGYRRGGRNAQNEPNFGRSFKFEVSSVKRIVQNEPNSRRSRVGRGQRGDGRGENAQNEPNSRRHQVERGRRGVGRGANVQNEANFHRPGGREAIVQNKANLHRSGRPDSPSFQDSDPRRGQTCETKPIPPQRQDGQVLGGMCETKPIFVPGQRDGSNTPPLPAAPTRRDRGRNR